MLYGFDIGGTKIAFSVYDRSLDCQFTEQSATPDDYNTLLNTIRDWVITADKKFKCEGLVGIGFPGAINCEDQTVTCANVKAIKGRPLMSDLSVLLAREIKLANDANCFTLSECFKGSADGCSTVLGLTLGTGIGGAICVNGEILTGKNTFAGEIGHYPLPATVFKKYPELPVLNCGCGRQMCLETYASGKGLSNLYQHYAKQILQAPAIVEKFRAGNETAHTVINIYFDILAAGIGTAVLLLDPDAIVFGGGLSKFEILIDELTKRLPKNLLLDVKLPLLVNAKFGSEGGVRGAALLNYKNQ